MPDESFRVSVSQQENAARWQGRSLAGRAQDPAPAVFGQSLCRRSLDKKRRTLLPVSVPEVPGTRRGGLPVPAAASQPVADRETVRAQDRCGILHHPAPRVTVCTHTQMQQSIAKSTYKLSDARSLRDRLPTPEITEHKESQVREG